MSESEADRMLRKQREWQAGQAAGAEPGAGVAPQKAGWKWWQITLAIVGGLFVLGLIAGDPDTAKTADSGSDVVAEAQSARADAEAAAAEARAVMPAIAESPESRMTGPQRNAVRSAKQYLAMSGFSRAGLIDQLSSEYGNGYEVADATVAVDSLTVDWNEQAVRSAEQYLEMTGFSCSGLIDQLSSDYGNKYTREQATFGAQQSGAC